MRRTTTLVTKAVKKSRLGVKICKSDLGLKGLHLEAFHDNLLFFYLVTPNVTFCRFPKAFKSRGYTGFYFPHGEIEVSLISPL